MLLAQYEMSLMESHCSDLASKMTSNNTKQMTIRKGRSPSAWRWCHTKSGGSPRTSNPKQHHRATTQQDWNYYIAYAALCFA